MLSLAISNEGELFAITSSLDILKIKTNNGDIIWSRNTAESLYANATDFSYSSKIVIDKDRIIFSSGDTFFSYEISPVRMLSKLISSWF